MSGSLPDGFGLALDTRLRRFRQHTVLAGGHPGRIMTLTPDGTTALDRLVEGTGSDQATRELAGRLVRAGMAHPRPPVGQPTDPPPDVTVVVPTRDRTGSLARCLASLGRRQRILVVDDASDDTAAIAAVCRAHGAEVVRRDTNGGPGAARTTGLDRVTTELVAFVDSDCVVPDQWLAGLAWLFADPAIAAVAPRIRPAETPDHRRSTRTRFGRSHCPLDLGPDEGEVGPDRAVRYVPTAALVVRRAALDAVGGFAPGMRVGEDVDLIWRLVESGWRIRYVPSVTVAHTEPARWRDLVARRFTYGTSAAPLAVRHPTQLAPVELRPRPLVAALALLAGRPGLAGGTVAATALSLARKVRPLGVPEIQAWRWAAEGSGWTIVGLGRAATMLAWPGLLALAMTGRRRRRAAAALLLVPPVVDWIRRRPDLDVFRWVAASVVDDVAYGAGVWTGCVRTHTLGPVLPTLRGDRQS